MLLEVIIIFFFVSAFLCIVFEEAFKMNKAKSALFFGTLGWIVLFLHAWYTGSLEQMEHAFEENILEIAMLWLFLIAAMTFVAYLDRRGLIENLVYRVLPDSIKLSKLLFAVGLFAFFFSAVADNMTATLVSLTILLALKLPLDKMIPFAVLVVFAANAGGVALITGDVTTLMIFLSGNVEMLSLLALMLPSFLAFITLYFFLVRGLNGQKIDIAKQRKDIEKIDLMVGGVFLGTILAIILGHVFFHIPPVLTFLFGLSLMFLLGWFHIWKKKEDPKLLHYIREAEFDALFFFLGVLLLVGMVKELGLLAIIAKLYDVLPNFFAHLLVGMTSAVFDNIPLTAALLKADLPLMHSDWLMLTYAVGVGGSLLSVGSAAGVVAMSKVEGLTFKRYLVYFFPVFSAFCVGYVASYALTFLLY